MKALFQNPDHQAFFESHGWIKLPMLEAAEVAELLDFYRSLPKGAAPEYGFHVSLDKDDLALKLDVAARLKAVVARKADAIFQDYKIFTASFVIKEHNRKGIVPPHQDWTIVDESEFFSVTVWTALMPVNMENGCMGVINGSHRFFEFVRASPSPQTRTPISDHTFALFPYMQLVEMQPGEALIFDNRTIHASPPNTSGSPRVAFGVGITQQDAPLYHHYMLPGQASTMARYAVEPDFFMQYGNIRLSELYDAGQSPPGIAPVAVLKRPMPEFTAEELLAMVTARPDNPKNQALLERLARLFNYNPDGSKQVETTTTAPVAAPAPSKFRRLLSQIFH